MTNNQPQFFWDIIGFPEAALLQKRVPKKQFLENGEHSARDKKLFREGVRNVYWEYTLKPSTCPVLPYKDSEREYLEIATLQIELAANKGYKRIAEIIHRMIPYPLFLCFYTEGNNLALSIAPKRYSQSEQGAYVVECFYTTGFIQCNRIADNDKYFFNSLSWSQLPLGNYHTIYNAWVDRFIAYECSLLSGKFSIGSTGSRNNILEKCRSIESNITELKTELKQAAFNKQVELNTKIKLLEQELKTLAVSL